MQLASKEAALSASQDDSDTVLPAAAQLFLQSLRAFFAACVGVAEVLPQARALAGEVLAMEATRFAGFGTMLLKGTAGMAAGHGVSGGEGGSSDGSVALEDCAAESLRFLLVSGSDEMNVNTLLVCARALCVLLHAVVERLLDSDVEVLGERPGARGTTASVQQCLREVNRCGRLHQFASKLLLRAGTETSPGSSDSSFLESLADLRHITVVSAALVTRSVQRFSPVRDQLADSGGINHDADLAAAVTTGLDVVAAGAVAPDPGGSQQTLPDLVDLAASLLEALCGSGLVGRVDPSAAGAASLAACGCLDALAASLLSRDNSSSSTAATSRGVLACIEHVVQCAAVAAGRRAPTGMVQQIDARCAPATQAAIKVVRGQSTGEGRKFLLDTLREAFAGVLEDKVAARRLPGTFAIIQNVCNGIV